MTGVQEVRKCEAIVGQSVLQYIHHRKSFLDPVEKVGQAVYRAQVDEPVIEQVRLPVRQEAVEEPGFEASCAGGSNSTGVILNASQVTRDEADPTGYCNRAA